MGRELGARQCSFCGKNEHQVARLIAGPRVFVCDECVALCNQILDEHGPDSPNTAPKHGLHVWWARARHACRDAIGLLTRLMRDRRSVQKMDVSV